MRLMIEIWPSHITGYKSIMECINLRLISITNTFFDGIDELFEILLKMPNINQIDVRPQITSPDQETADEENR